MQELLSTKKCYMSLTQEFFYSLFPSFEYGKVNSMELTALILLIIFLVYYVLSDLRRLRFFKKNRSQDNNGSKGVSLVIPTRNHYDVLKPVLDSLLKQDYPDFEVVVVDDCSEDSTPIQLQKMTQEYDNLIFTRVFNDTNFSNALSLTMGVRASTKEWVVFLTPNMQPVESNYLSMLMSNVKDNDTFVQGLCNYESHKCLSNYFLRLHLFKYGVDYFTNANMSSLVPALPYNIGYKRSAFEHTKGFRAFLDEKFYVNEWYSHGLTKGKASVAMALDSGSKVTLTDPYERDDFMNQREKYLLIKQRYGFGQKVLSFIRNWGWVVATSSLLFLAFNSIYKYWGLMFFLLFSLVHLLVVYMISKQVKEKIYIVLEYLSRILWPFYSFYYWMKLHIARQRRKWN